MEALTTAVAIMRNADAPAQVKLAAVNIVLDRGHGRPSLSIDQTITGADGGAIQIHHHFSG